jgi:DNA-binding IclR family transcriptional regulator
MTTTGTGTVERTIALLRHLASRDDDFGVSDTAAELGLPPSTIHRLLELLAGEGMVERNGTTHRYHIGIELFRLSAMVQARFPIRRLALPVMRRVVELCDETCILCLFLPASAQMIFAERVDSTKLLRYQIELNVPLPVAWGASGRSFLPFLPPGEIERALAASGASPVTGETLPPRQEFERELARIRARGYAISRGEKIGGAVGIAAPIFDTSKWAIGALGVTIPEIRFRRVDEPRLARLLLQEAAELSHALGYPKDVAVSKAGGGS